MNLFSPIRILVVDDEESIRRLIEKEIGGSGRKILTAGTAREAVRMAQDQVFDVIVLDIRLPDGDGIALLSHFRQAIPDVEVVLITGHGDVDSAVEAMKIGAYDYITKPFMLEKPISGSASRGRTGSCGAPRITSPTPGSWDDPKPWVTSGTSSTGWLRPTCRCSSSARAAPARTLWPIPFT